jgi:hypothetical protein
MLAAPESINVMLSHFNNGVLGTESAQPVSDVKIAISADAIIQAFQQYRIEGLDEQQDMENQKELSHQIALLLEDVSSELNLMGVQGFKGLYKLAENDEERAAAIASVRELEGKIAFFSHLLTELRKMIVIMLTNAHLDPFLFEPQFKDAMKLIQARADEYQAQIGGFEEFIAREAQH